MVTVVNSKADVLKAEEQVMGKLSGPKIQAVSHACMTLEPLYIERQRKHCL